MGDRISIPGSYEQSRQRFLGNLAAARDLWPAARLDRYILSDAPNLSIDWITADALQHKQRLFILTTGEHGIEGYVGSAMMQLFIDEFLPHFDPQTTGILLVHAINPWGMKHHRCANHANVDLNRNFISDFSLLETFNPDFTLLDDFFNPKGAIQNLFSCKLKFFLRIPGLIRRYGVRRIREAALMGQYVLPEGMLFGGTSAQEETRTMMELYETHIRDYEQILHLDMHTGYGPRDQMTLVNSAREGMNADETAGRFGVPRVAGINPEEFYTIQGDMTDYLYDLVAREFSGKSIYSATFEFGTYGDSLLAGVRSLLITILDNQLACHGGGVQAQAQIRREYDELYCPSEPAWFEKAMQDARQAFDGILGVEGYVSK
jgi:hypothetical protein